MYLLAVCDDEMGVCNQLEGYLGKYAELNYINVEIAVFYSGESICEYLKKNRKVSVLFLDIELPKINGVKVGQYIRNHLENEIIDIVYISSKTHYAMELFQCRPVDFLVKPLEYKRVEQIMNIIVKKNKIIEMYFEYKSGHIMQRIPVREIIYFRSDDKRIHILGHNNEESFIGKLQDVENKLLEKKFLRIHKSYLINCDYVKEYNYEWIKMSNEDILSVSKAYRKEVRKKLMEYEF